MILNTYTDTHRLRGAFVANLLGRLADIIVEQGEQLLLDAGIDFPSRSVSTVLMIGETGKISAADIAMALNQPHQLVTQRIELLLDMRIVKRVSDPKDGRRKILMLTVKGTRQFKQLQKRLALAERAFETLFEDIDCDLISAAERAMDALTSNTILQRVKSDKP
jgi:DNA-binding MarR family transcriptional regulator